MVSLREGRFHCQKMMMNVLDFLLSTGLSDVVMDQPKLISGQEKPLVIMRKGECYNTVIYPELFAEPVVQRLRTNERNQIYGFPNKKG